MRVRITSAFYACAPEGHTVHRHVQGDIVTGRVAEMALADKAGEPLDAIMLEHKIVSPDEKKTRRKRAAA